MGKRGCLFVVVVMVDYVCMVSAIPDDECPDAYPARENCEFDEVCEDASCKYNQYVTCHLNRCGTCEAVFRGYDNVTVSCNQLTPKCRLLHLEILHKSRTASRQPGGRRIDDLYDPECERNGTFKAKQCDDDSNLCWCVDSAGVRVTDKTGDDPKCDQLVRVHLIQIDFSFKVEFVFLKMKEEALRRKVAIKLVKEYTLKATQIVEIKDPLQARTENLAFQPELHSLKQHRKILAMNEDREFRPLGLVIDNRYPVTHPARVGIGWGQNPLNNQPPTANKPASAHLSKRAHMINRYLG